MNKLQGISSIFGDGMSQTTWFGRSLDHNKLLLQYAPDRQSILSLGSGAIEPFELSKLTKGNSKITAVDFQKNVADFYTGFLTNKIIGPEIEEIFKNPLVGKKSIRSDYKSRQELIDKRYLSNINFLPKHFADFFQSNKQKYNIILTHNLLNNLRFQKDTATSHSLLNVYKESFNTLHDKGLFSIVDNYEWFQNDFKGQFSTLKLIEESGFELLCNYPAYISKTQYKDIQCINENNNIILAKKGSDVFLPIKKRALLSYFGDLLLEYNIQGLSSTQGSYSDFKASINDCTNIFVVKISPTEYFWCNVMGSYQDAFSELLKSGFSPKPLKFFCSK